MKSAPYNLSEAEKLCTQYQYLVGKPFGRDSNAIISCVAIAPFDQNSKNRFTIFYLLFDDAETALQHEYKGLLYDVIVIASSPTDKNDLHQDDIYTWVSKNMNSVNQRADLSVMAK
jgi:tryptophanase